MNNEKVRVETLNLVRKTDRKKYTTPDGKYSLTTEVTRNEQCVTECNGGQIVREDGAPLAQLQSWTPYGGTTVAFQPSTDIVEAAAVVKQLTDAMAADSEEEGGEA